MSMDEEIVFKFSVEPKDEEQAVEDAGGDLNVSNDGRGSDLGSSLGEDAGSRTSSRGMGSHGQGDAPRSAKISLKPEKFDGEADWKEYMAQFMICADYGRLDILINNNYQCGDI